MLPITFMCNFPPLVTFYGWLSPKLFPKPSVFQRRGRFPAQSRITLISKASLCVPDVHVEHCAVSPRFLTVFFSSRSSLPFGREPDQATARQPFLRDVLRACPQLRSSQAAEHTVQGDDATQGKQAAFWWLWPARRRAARGHRLCIPIRQLADCCRPQLERCAGISPPAHLHCKQRHVLRLW